MQVLRASDYKRMPWKNGGGETVEIAVFPPSASVNDFDWRISMATVATDGPFSIFAGIDRTLSILDGKGMELAIDGQPALLLEQESRPLAFAADVPVDATLSDGPIIDLNVMTRRSVFGHSVERVHIPYDGISSSGEIVMILPMASAEVTIGNNKQWLGRLDAAVITDEAAFLVEAAEEAVSVFVIRLEKLPV